MNVVIPKGCEQFASDINRGIVWGSFWFGVIVACIAIGLLALLFWKFKDKITFEDKDGQQ